MSWWNPLSWGRAAPVPVELAAADGRPDLSDFERGTWSWTDLGFNDVVTLATYGMGVRPETPPHHVPADVLDAMGWHPVIYAGESLLTAPATDPELYYLRGPETADGKRAVAEVEAWLRPLLCGQRAPLLSQIVRAAAYGAVPIVLDWGVRPLSFEQDAENAKGKITRTIPGHVHYVASHELWPGDCSLLVQPGTDKLLGVRVGQREYGAEDLDEPGRVRAFLALWDPQFGRWIGQGSRRRAFRDWLEEGMTRVWEMRYTERSVDLWRVGYAPEGTIKINGQEVLATKLLRAQIMSMRNGSAMVLPSTQDANGQPAWRVEFPQPPARHEGFKHAVDSRAARMLLASLCPTDLNKANEEAFLDGVQRVCDFAARTLTRVITNALRLRYGDRAPFVQVLANDLPKRKIRTMTEVFRTVSGAVQHTADGRTYTLAELVHPEILDQIGVRARTVEEAAHKAPTPPAIGGPPGPKAPTPPAIGGPPGPDQDLTSDREDRREDSRTIDGERDTGGENGPEREERDA